MSLASRGLRPVAELAADRNRIEFGDCRETMRRWAADGVKVQTCVTSPPYFGLRDYGHEGQIGLEPTPEAYIAAMVEVFRCVREVLADDGTLWLNIGDSYAAQRGGTQMPAETLAGGSGGKALDADAYRGRGFSPKTLAGQESAASRNAPVAHRNCKAFGLKHKDLIGIPWMLAFALRADGWYLRQDIIWHKPNPMPESVRDRCTKAHEYIFLLSKSERYFFDADAIRQPAAENSKGKTWDERKAMGFRGDTKHPTKDAIEAGLHIPSFAPNENGVNRRSVWTVSTKPYKGAHFATFPPDLIEPCILAGSRQGDVVLDPFMGSGTTAQVAVQHGRQYLGCELNPAYEPLQRSRLSGLQMAL
jgi:DNA modification methylase